MDPLNNVETTVTIAGIKVSFVKLTLSQEFNAHHKLEVLVDFDQLDILWMNDIVSLINKMGESIIVTMTHRQTGDTNIFGGIITNVSAVGQHGEQNYYLITGMSNSIKLDGRPSMDSFCDKSLKDIVDEIKSTSGNGAEIKNEPKYSGVIDYFCQYNESAFEVINRLSWLYNEWFFNDGNNTYFGKPSDIEETTLVYDLDITNFNLTASLIPAKYNQYAYLPHRPTEICQQAPDSVPGVRGFIQATLNKSDEIYTSNAFSPLEPIISDSGELTDLIESDKSRAVSQMLVFEGESLSCKVKIGSYAQILLPTSMKVSKMVEKFLITKVVHTVDQSGHYQNTFSGIPADMKSVPMKCPPLPRTGPQIATVSSSVDEEGKGRIKVELQWQKLVGKTTNWIRVQTPDAGVSDKVGKNRGFVFIPEEGDQVMIAFEYNDPSRPFVQGSMYPEDQGSGGGSGNNTKSLTTKSGSTVTLDEEKGNVLISDQTGNDAIIIDGVNKISIITTKTIELNNGKSCIVLDDENILIKATNILIDGETNVVMCNGESEGITITTEGDANIAIAGPKMIVGAGESIFVNGGNNLDITSKAITINGDDTLDITSGLVKINS